MRALPVALSMLGALAGLTTLPVRAAGSWQLAIHGGAGVLEKGDLTPAKEAAYRAGLAAALEAGSQILRAGGTSLDAVEAAVRVMEDDPLFNAGKGAVFTADGRNELDASIMDGHTRKAGAVASVTRTRNPVSLARAVMEKSPHVMLTGAGADAFSVEKGLEQVDPGYFRTEERWQQYLDWKRDPTAMLKDRTHAYGTVGAVALDQAGHLAAATSTGGLTGKRWGRVGDSPIIGAGTYADDACAVSATGTGEFFIRSSAARQVRDRMVWQRKSVQSAVNGTLKDIGSLGGDGALMAMDAKGHVAFAMNTLGMYRGTVGSDSAPHTAIYATEK